MSIDTALAKIGRAEEHAETLHREIRAWSDGGTKSTTHRDANGTRFSARIYFIKQPDLMKWGLIFSDAVHNLRCALDQTVFAVAESYKPIPLHIVHRVKFPICNTATNFAKFEKGLSLVLPAPVIQRIESVQPYRRKHAECPPLLAVLRDLNDFDKHRLSTPTLNNMAEGAFRVIGGDLGERASFHPNTGNLESGAELFVYQCERPRPDLKYQFNTRIVVGMAHERGPQGADRTQVNELFRILRDEVVFVVTSLCDAGRQWLRSRTFT